jgi:hypothetical protein
MFEEMMIILTRTNFFQKYFVKSGSISPESVKMLTWKTSIMFIEEAVIFQMPFE